MSTVFVEESARELAAEGDEPAYSVAKEVADWLLQPKWNEGSGWIAGLYGGRGSGKTSILRTILRILHQRTVADVTQGQPPAWVLPMNAGEPGPRSEAVFSPAETRDGDDLLFGLLQHLETHYVAQVSLAPGSEPTALQKAFQEARKAEVRRKDLPRFLQYAQETAASKEKIPDKFVEQHREEARTTQTLREEFGKIERELISGGACAQTKQPPPRGVVLFVDDVDLQPHRTLEMLELLHVFFQRLRVVVIVAADRDLMLRSIADALQKRHLGQPGLAGALLAKYVPYGWNVPGPSEEQRFDELWKPKPGVEPILPDFWTGRWTGEPFDASAKTGILLDPRAKAKELLTPLLPTTYRGLKATHNRLTSLQSEILANSDWRRDLFAKLTKVLGLPEDLIGAALSACVAVDAQRPELGALAAFLEHPSLLRETMAWYESKSAATSAWGTDPERATADAVRAIAQQLGRVPDFLLTQAQRPSGALDVQPQDLPLLDRLGPPFVEGRDLGRAKRLVIDLVGAILALAAESRRARPRDWFLAISLNADAYGEAETLRLERGFVAQQEIDIDLRAFAPNGRATKEELREARNELRAKIEESGVRSLRGRIDLYARAQLPLMLWLGWYLRQAPGRFVAHNAQRQNGETTLVDFVGPDDRVQFRDSGTYEVLAMLPSALAPKNYDTAAVVVIDLVGRSSPSDLDGFEPPVETAHRYRMRFKDQPAIIGPEHVRPILRDVAELFGRLRNVGVAHFHLGFAGPDVVAFFLGQQMNAWGEVHLYERYGAKYERVFQLDEG